MQTLTSAKKRKQEIPKILIIAWAATKDATIALTGGRTEPIYWGRVGDPINPPIFDYYALSKVFSELAVFDSGLKHWVSIRQSGMHPVAWGAGDHEFPISVNAVLHGGHWCPQCLSHEWQYGQIAKKNPFYAQVWNPLHGEEDDYVIPMEYSGYDIAEKLKKK